jgi:hypothetical protein
LGKKVIKTYEQSLLFYEFFNLCNELWSYPDSEWNIWRQFGQKKGPKLMSKAYCSMNFLIYATTFGHTQIHTATGIWELSAPATHTLIFRDLSANSGYNFN